MTTLDELEIWKDIYGYEKLYQVSNYGRIKSLPRGTSLGRTKIERILKANPVPNDYLVVSLNKNNVTKTHSVHRLVANAFIVNSESKPQVNHKDGNKRNNYYLNLEWSTRSENQIHAIRTGLRTAVGIKHNNCKLTEEQVLIIFKSTEPYRLLAEKFNISIGNIYSIKKGDSWNLITKMPRTRPFAECTEYKPYITRAI